MSSQTPTRKLEEASHEVHSDKKRSLAEFVKNQHRVPTPSVPHKTLELIKNLTVRDTHTAENSHHKKYKTSEKCPDYILNPRLMTPGHNLAETLPSVTVHHSTQPSQEATINTETLTLTQRPPVENPTVR